MFMKVKKGVVLIELIGALALSSIVALLLSSVILFVSRGTSLITENSVANNTSSNISLGVLVTLNSFTITDCKTLTDDSATSYKGDSITFESTRQYYYDDALKSVASRTPDNENWTGAKALTYEIDYERNALHVISTMKDNTTTMSYYEFSDSKIITGDNTFIRITTQSSNSYLLEISIEYYPEHNSSSNIYYSSIYVNKV